ncbi:MAG: FAD-dependent oxidoreductase [Bacteroidia bacterium]
MAKSPLISALKTAFRLSMSSESSDIQALIEEEQAKQISRRLFLSQSAKAGLWLGASTMLPQWVYAAKNPPKIAVIGAGLAGLTAAYQLKKAGLAVDIYEGSKRLGGRVHSKPVLSRGLMPELGGEFIDSQHLEILQLIKEFNLELLDMQDAKSKLQPLACSIAGQAYGMKDFVKEFKNVAPQIIKDKKSIDFALSSPSAIQLDKTPLKQYIESWGTSQWFKEMMHLAYTTEFGLETDEQSALNLIQTIGTDLNKFQPLGEGDARFKIKGGNDLLIDKLSADFESSMNLGHVLRFVEQKGKKYVLTFEKDRSGSTFDVEYDFAILAIPFSTMREFTLKVKDIPKEKVQCVKELGYGTNAKLIVGMMRRVWRDLGYEGNVFSDEIQSGWDNSLMLNGNTGPGGYTIFTGGKVGAEFNHFHDIAMTRKWLPKLDKVFLGAKEAHNGYTTIADWSKQSLFKGSQACYKVGQQTTLGGWEAKPLKNLLFAGEHCSQQFRGTMNGAVETGKAAATLIISRLKGESNG